MKSRQILLWLAAIGFFMETLDSTIVYTALPTMAKSLGESPIRMQSVVIAYSLTLAILIPASGWLADNFGTRRVYLSAIAVFTLGSLLCALSHSLFQLTLSRVIQGLGGSMLMPVGRLAVLKAFPGESFLAAISFVTMPALIGPLIGPTLGGWIVEYTSWHWIFLINLPIGGIGCIATYYAMPDRRAVKRSGFDGEGFLLLVLSMVSISFGLDGLAELEFAGATTAVLIIFGLACLAAYWLKAAQKKNPLFSPSFSVAICAVVLKAFLGHLHGPQDSAGTVNAFRGTFLCMGAITCCSAAIFLQLSPDTKISERADSHLEAG